MKKIVLYAVALATAGIITMSFAAKDCGDNYLGTKTLYTPTDTSVTPAPQGYAPVFINYVGRHGARHVTNTRGAQAIARLMDKAAAANALTPDGEKLQLMIKRYLTIEKKENLGLLTQRGKDELFGIGRRIAANYPQVFATGNCFKVVTTKEKRTCQSAEAFLAGASLASAKYPCIITDSNNFTDLRFYEISPNYRQFEKKGDWNTEMDQLKSSDRAKAVNKAVAHKIFKNDFADKIMQGQLSDSLEGGHILIYSADKIADELFSLASIKNAIGIETKAAGYTPQDLDMNTVFTCDQMTWLGYVNAAEDYVVKGPGLNANGIQVRDAAPLLVDFINTTDSFISGGKNAAILRFAHAETMAPIAALMEIEGASTASKELDGFDKTWNASQIISFSANLQWILYRGKRKDDYLIKILYNEKPAHIPVTTNHFPYYNWADVRKFYIAKLSKLHIALTDDMQQYLVNLK